ncbi:hypothetical protein [Actinopolymorpha pittospori]|uniref:Uncharacterized protein n=1 Tax=Actinopolymorpha pittospori TaxID=648752 RepID=A0A927R7I2_9ACTN|nr:hypothetical protein [Actinopolymorpha pittospori]MBE1605612.1 hypothetical protein [Actinopolymorpha pittospori]
MSVSREPGQSSREYVADQQDQADGVPIVLPVDLPDGYDSGSDYGNINLDKRDEPYDTPATVDGREVSFIPVEGVQGHDGLPAIQLCIEDANAKDAVCPSDPHAIHRRHGGALLTFYAASDRDHDLSAWQTVELTTDLNKVTWLH